MPKTDIQSLRRKDLIHLKPYLPDRNKENSIDDTWIDSNENPFSETYGRYPDPQQKVLRNKLSEVKDLPFKNILISHGSDEAIDLIIRTFCEPKVDRITHLVPGFEMYRHAAELSSVGVRTIRQSQPFQFDKALVEQILEEQNKILFLCSPNNPTGKSISSEILHKILKRWNGLVVLDEAYIDFAPYESRMYWISQYPKLIVLQTFSKAWGLAGLRIGMTFAHSEVIEAIEAIKIPYNVSQYSADQACLVLENNLEQEQLIKDWLIEKERLINALNDCSEIKAVQSSDANFMLVECEDSQNLYQYLKEKGIYTRLRREPECQNCIRISVGTPNENDAGIAAIRSFPKSKLL